MPRYVQRVRYPPFELDHMDPSKVPIAEAILYAPESDVTEFIIGNEDDWIVEWRKISDSDENKNLLNSEVGFKPPKFLERSRTGWYIDPDPLHNISRRLIFPTVSLLIVSLFIHAIEPGLVDLGIIGGTIAGSLEIGPLEYPRLLFFTFPIFLVPLLFRTIANFRDMSRQKKINNDPYEKPDITIQLDRDSASLTINDCSDIISPFRARVQVGVAVPERDSILKSLNRLEGGQPSPGMSTRFPDKRVASGDEVGIGVGEATPMQLTTRRSVILEPMRIMETGDWSEIFEVFSPVDLPLPIGNWPGSIYSSLIAIHWEIVIEFKETDGSIIKWVCPILMPQSSERTEIEFAPIRSGRSELSSY